MKLIEYRSSFGEGSLWYLSWDFLCLIRVFIIVFKYVNKRICEIWLGEEGFSDFKSNSENSICYLIKGMNIKLKISYVLINKGWVI